MFAELHAALSAAAGPSVLVPTCQMYWRSALVYSWTNVCAKKSAGRMSACMTGSALHGMLPTHTMSSYASILLPLKHACPTHSRNPYNIPFGATLLATPKAPAPMAEAAARLPSVRVGSALHATFLWPFSWLPQTCLEQCPDP